MLSGTFTAFKQQLTTIFPHGSIRRRMASGTFWTIASSTLTSALGLVLAVFSARLLGADGYGQLGMLLTNVNLFVSFAILGLNVTLVKFVAEFRDKEPQRMGRLLGNAAIINIATGLIVAAFFALVAPWFVKEVLRLPGAVTEFRISAVIMFFFALNSGYQTSVLNGYEEFKVLARANFIRGVVAFPVVIAGIISLGFKGAVIAYALTSISNFVIYRMELKRLCAKRGILISCRFDKEYFFLLIRFTTPVCLAVFSFTPAVWLANVFLATRGGYDQVGIFNAALQWQTVILFFSNAVSNMGMPMLSNASPEKNSGKYSRLLFALSLLTVGLTVMVALPVAAASNLIMWCYGGEFASGGMVLLLISLSAVIFSMNIPVGQVIWSLGATVSGVALAFLRGILLVAAAYFLAPQGAVGLAAAYVIMGLIHAAVQVPFVFWLVSRQKHVWAQEAQGA